MGKYHKVFIICLMFLFLVPIKVYASTSMKINDLIENALSLDGQTVTITAEAIGERMDRPGGTWVNVNDGTNAIGIWMDTEDADRITSYGSYKAKGDMLEITGVFNRACKEHGGESDIHFSSMKTVAVGYSMKEEIPGAKVVLTLILTATSLLFLTFFMNQSKYIHILSEKTGKINDNHMPHHRLD